LPASRPTPRVSLFVWLLPLDLSGLCGPTSSYVIAGIALRVSGALNPHHNDKVGIASVGQLDEYVSTFEISVFEISLTFVNYVYYRQHPPHAKLCLLRISNKASWTGRDGEMDGTFRHQAPFHKQLPGRNGHMSHFIAVSFSSRYGLHRHFEGL
jgi:hypothetical protein